MGLLREMETIKGSMLIRGTVFYVAQEPWIFTSTLKQNILFGMSYDKEKFDSVIKACSLEKVNQPCRKTPQTCPGTIKLFPHI